jgi:DNA (cytosine-5)-methyltransferase 1
MLKIGSLCSGYGGLDMAVEAYFNAETVWMCDNDKYASIVIKERWNLPNLGDLKTVDWSSVEPIDILTAGYPCQPFSQAGQRKGIEDERHIFPYIMQAIGILRPRFIILENVRGHLSLGFKEVLKSLAETGYDAKWRVVRASEAGAPHQRARLFIIAYPISKRCKNQLSCEKSNEFVKSATADTNSYARQKSRRTNRSVYGSSSEIINRSNWKERGLGFEITERKIPPTLVEGKLNAKFVEYIMGLPEGWVTDLDISRSQQLKILGNGVVPQQAYYALQLLCDTPIIEREEEMNLTEALC